MADRLVVVEECHLYRIQWECDGDLGGYLCQDKKDGKGEPPKAREEWEHWAASRAVRETEGVEVDATGAYWGTLKEANSALRVAKAAMKQDRPLPEWATTALSQGWMMPKGWKA